MTYLFLQNENEIAKVWHTYAGFTVRPQKSMVNFYEKYVATLPQHAHSFLFGSTPEIRELYRRHQQLLTIADQSRLMINSMGRVIEAEMPVSSNETIVMRNWLNLPNFTHVFDLALGDDAINMIPWNSFSRFLANAARLLKPRAIFLCHLLIKPDDCLIDTTVDDVLREYQEGTIETEFELASRLNFLCFDKTNYRMGWQQTIACLGETGLKRVQHIFDFKKKFSECNSFFYCPPQAAFEELASEFFDIEQIFYSYESEFCRFEPLYILRKKGS